VSKISPQCVTLSYRDGVVVYRRDWFKEGFYTKTRRIKE